MRLGLIVNDKAGSRGKTSCNPPKGIGLIATIVWSALERQLQDVVRLQSPEGDWADCDEVMALGILSQEKELQSPEGDWADCDYFLKTDRAVE